MVGSAFGGLAADLIGRRLSLVISLTCACITALVIVFTPVMSLFIALRFLLSVFLRTFGIAQFVLLMEVTAPNKRVLLTNVYFLAFALAYFFLAGLAKLIYSWRLLHGVITAFLFSSLIPLYLFVLESPRWLLSKGRTATALKILNRMAVINKRKDVFLQDEDVNDSCAENEAESGDIIGTLKKLIRSPALMITTVSMAFNWSAQSFVFYGLTLSTSSLGIDPYLSFAISGAIEIPAHFACILVVERMGRKPSMVIIMVLGGLCCCCSTLFPMGLIRALTAMSGKFCITMTFSIVYTWSAELIPTSSRTTGMGLFSMCSRVGGILAPLMLLFEDIWINLPYLIFGVTAIVVGLLALLIPETKGKPLPTTL